MKERFFQIDFLRAVAIIAVVFIHVFSFNLTSPTHLLVWNYLHFIIVAFLFCSGFVLFAKYKDTTFSFATTLTFYKKRIIRIVVPFYIYLAASYLLTFFLPKFFSGMGIKFTWGYVLDSVILLDGMPLNWLPLLFVGMALLFPLLLRWNHKRKILFFLYILVGLLSLIGFSVWIFPYQYYRYVMWLPWSVFFVLPWYFYGEKYLTKKYLALIVGPLGLYLLCLLVWQMLHRPLNLIDNKYPPNLFYVSYETAGTFVVLLISEWVFWQQRFIKDFVLFLSKWSYALFFLHYLYIDFVLQTQKTFHFSLSVWEQLAIVLGMSVISISVYARMRKALQLLVHNAQQG